MSKKESILKEYDDQCKLYEDFAHKMRLLLQELTEKEHISCNAITCRLKQRDKLDKKIDLKQDKYSSLKEITDIAGVRIITYYSDDVDKVASIIEEQFNVDRENSIDKRKAIEPDRFGYCSVHYIVSLNSNREKLPEYERFKGLKFEIQVRTILQHAWAEIEHDLGYKSEIAVPDEVKRNFSRIAGLLEIGDKEFLEIRKFLSDYTKDVTDKIENNELNDRKLDAIILKEFIKTDKTVDYLNNEIGKIARAKIEEPESNGIYEMALKELNAVGISTLGQLKKLLKENKENALVVANEVFSQDKDYNGIHNTICIFYLCYCALLKTSTNTKQILDYLSYLRISASTSFAQKLLNIKPKLKF